jgi:hypothetical protein
MRPPSKSASQILLEKRLFKAREDIIVFTSTKNNLNQDYNPNLNKYLRDCIDIAIKDFILTKEKLLDEFGVITRFDGEIIGNRR